MGWYGSRPEACLDHGFGSDGTAAVTFNPLGVALDPAGRIVLTGDATRLRLEHAPPLRFALARYTDDGRKDAGFDLDGEAIVDFPDRSADNYGQDVALQPDGKVVVAGVTWSGSSTRIVVTRYTAAGALDTTFGVNGTADTGLRVRTMGASRPASPCGTTAPPRGSDDKILVAGASSGLARLTMTAPWTPPSATRVGPS